MAPPSEIIQGLEKMNLNSLALVLLKNAASDENGRVRDTSVINTALRSALSAKGFIQQIGQHFYITDKGREAIK